MVVAGRNHGLAKLIQVHAVKVRELLPIELDKNLLPDYLQVFDRAVKAERTPKGRGHPIMRLERDDAGNEAVWATFPPYYWCHPVTQVKPRSITLLEQSGASPADRTCLMAIHRYYEGAVFYCGLDSLWRWRFPYESYDYDRFWVNVIRYLGETRLRGTQQQVALATDRASYAPGEEVQVRLRVLDPALMAQLEGQTLYASVDQPAERRADGAAQARPERRDALPWHAPGAADRQHGGPRQAGGAGGQQRGEAVVRGRAPVPGPHAVVGGARDQCRPGGHEEALA